MSFGAPFAFWWLLLAVPLVALFFLRVQPRKRTVSTLLFWQEVIPDSRPRRWWRTLRDPLFLALQLLLLLLIVAALAQPQNSAWTGPPKRIVLVLDNSASMQAIAPADTNPGQAWDQATQAAERLIKRLRAEDTMTLVTAAPAAQVQLGFTSHTPALRRQLQQITVTDAPGHLPAAIDLSRRLLADNELAELWVITDASGQRQCQDAVSERGAEPTVSGSVDSGILEAEAASEEAAGEEAAGARNVSTAGEPNDAQSSVSTRWLVVGAPAENSAITQFELRRQRNDPASFELLVQLENFGTQPVDAELTLQLEGSLLDVLPVRIDPGQPQRVTRSYLSRDGGVLQATLAPDDALDCDNRAWAVLAPCPPISILLVSPGSIYLERVLAALPGVQLETATALPERLQPNQFVVLDRQPLERLPVGRSLVIDLRSPNALADLQPAAPATGITAPDLSSPLLYHVRWDDITLDGVRPLAWRFPATTLVQSLGGDPVVTRVRHSQGESLVLNLSLGNSDLAWRAAFPLLMSNLIGWLAERPERDHLAVRSGQSVRTEFPTASLPAHTDLVDTPSRWQWIAPDGSRHAATRIEQELVLGPWEQTGIWTLSPAEPDQDAAVAAASREPASVTEAAGANREADKQVAVGEPSRWAIQAACNLVSSSESDLRFGAARSDTMLATLAVHPAWFWLTLVAILVLGAEWWFYQRRYIG
jgi:hypothetical protein